VRRGRYLEQPIAAFKPMRFLGEGNYPYPYFQLDLDLDKDGVLRARPRLKKVISAEKPHSLFSYRGFLFYVSQGKLYLYGGVDSAEIADIGPDETLYYVGIAHVVYMSNRNWQGIFDFQTFGTRPFPTKEKIVRQFLPDIGVPLEEADFETLPPLDFLTFHQGRLVGARETTVIFSETGFYEMTRPFYYIEIGEPVTMVASALDTLYVGTKTKTVVVTGPLTNPSYREVPVGAVKGTLAYKAVKGVKIPFWATLTSIVAGLPGGEIKPMSKEFFDLRFDTEGKGAAVSSEHDDRVIMSVPQAPDRAKVTDDFICEVVRKGSVRKALKQ